VKVYRSAFAALERAIASSGDTHSEAAEARRKALKVRIVEIEAEFLPAEGARTSPGPGAHAGAPEVEPDLRREAGERVLAPSLDDAEPAGGTVFEPRLEPGDYREPAAPADMTPSQADAPRGRRPRRPRRAGGSLARFLLVLLVLLAAIGAGLWWAGNTGLFLIAGEPESASDNPPKTLQQENFQSPAATAGAPGSSAANENWITIFSPADPTTVMAPATGHAAVMEEETGKFLRIQSGSAGSEFTFEVGKGVLEQIAGKHAVFDIVAHSEEGKETQMSVNCDFGALGDCGRKRYQVGHERNDFLFEADLPAKKPSGVGKITIDPDLDGKGNPLDVVEIRVSVSG
jgi:hypothetical protein